MKVINRQQANYCPYPPAFKYFMMMKIPLILFCFVSMAFLGGSQVYAQPDTLRVMAYNVLGYGQFNPCQGPDSKYNAYLDTIVQFANPDIIGLEKMGSIQTSPTDFAYDAPIGFQDSILQYALNLAFPGRFNYCMNTNFSGSNTECLVFYNQHKLGYLGIVCAYNSGAGNEDFDTYKFYYLDPNLPTTHDTTFLYVTDNHDISGSSNQALRGAQIAGEMTDIKNHFTHLANMINMGDFNVRNTSEPVYQTLTNPADTNFRYYDPPFNPDHNLSYPADWDGNPGAFTSYLTTSTRVSATLPNACGTSGGGKNWYDHIFLSPWIINNANYISYSSHSYRTIGNDGHRLSRSVNDLPANTSAPTSVINSLFQMSNKYPVMVDLLLWPNTTGTSLPDPEIVPSAVAGNIGVEEHIVVVNPVGSELIINCSSGLNSKTLSLICTDMLGRLMIREQVQPDNGLIHIPCKLVQGIYFLNVSEAGKVVSQTVLRKE